MKSLILSTILAISLCTIQSHAWTYSKTNVLEFLNSWQDQIAFDPYIDEEEKDARLHLLNRFIFQIDRKYENEDLKQFLISISWDMALTDEMRINRIYGSDAILLKNLNYALKEIIEPAENVLAFLRSFIEYSGAKKPKSLDELIALRAYANQYEIEAAQTDTDELRESFPTLDIENSNAELNFQENIQDSLNSSESNPPQETQNLDSPPPSENKRVDENTSLDNF